MLEARPTEIGPICRMLGIYLGEDDRIGQGARLISAIPTRTRANVVNVNPPFRSIVTLEISLQL